MPPAIVSAVLPGRSTVLSGRPASMKPVNRRSAASRRASACGPAASTSIDRETRLVRVGGQVLEDRPQPGLDPLRPGRLGPPPEGRLRRRSSTAAEQDVVGGEEAVLLAVEEFVERLPRDPRGADHVDDPGLGEAARRDHLDHRLRGSGRAASRSPPVAAGRGGHGAVDPRNPRRVALASADTSPRD